MTLFRPVDGGCYPEAYPATMALSSEGLFVPSQVTFHNVAPWSQPSSSSGCGAREWQEGEYQGARKLSQHLFSWAPAKKQSNVSKEALTLPEERQQDDCQLWSCCNSPAGPQLLGLAGSSSHLSVSSLVTAALEMEGGHTNSCSYEVGLCQLHPLMVFCVLVLLSF